MNSEEKDKVFMVVVYITSTYLILTKGSKYVNIIGIIVMLSHIYKDYTKMKEWPYWTELIAYIMGCILIYEGRRINKTAIIIIGIIILCGHMRQLILFDHRYYY